MVNYYIIYIYIAPRMAGLLVKVFGWLLESPIFGGILLYFLKKNNLIHKVKTNSSFSFFNIFHYLNIMLIFH